MKTSHPYGWIYQLVMIKMTFNRMRKMHDINYKLDKKVIISALKENVEQSEEVVLSLAFHTKPGVEFVKQLGLSPKLGVNFQYLLI